MILLLLLAQTTFNTANLLASTCYPLAQLVLLSLEFQNRHLLQYALTELHQRSNLAPASAPLTFPPVPRSLPSASLQLRLVTLILLHRLARVLYSWWRPVSRLIPTPDVESDLGAG